MEKLDIPKSNKTDQSEEKQNKQEFINSILLQPLQIDDLLIQNRLALAPMAGTSDTVFRCFASQMGAGLVTTELISAKGICHDPELKKNYQYLEINPQTESCIAIQLFGHEPLAFQKALEIILEHPILSQCHFIDINMGCPVKKVVKQGAGSALMKNPELAEKIVQTVRQFSESYHKKVSVKFRSGWDQNQINAVEFAKMLEAAGAQLITVHARTREQMYQGKADWHIIKKVKDVVNIPVYGNGDLHDLESIKAMHQLTACDGFSIGRAAQGNPWIFSNILNSNNSIQMPAKEEWLALIFSHLEQEIAKEQSERSGIIKMRSQFSYYLKGRRNSAAIRNSIMQCTNKDQIKRLLESVDFT